MWLDAREASIAVGRGGYLGVFELRRPIGRMTQPRSF